MSTEPFRLTESDWRRELPTLSGRLVALREPVPQDLQSLVDLLSLEDAARFGLGESISDGVVQQFIVRARQDRAAGSAFTYVVTTLLARVVCGLVQVRQLDPGFESAEWECTLTPASRGTGVFLEAAHLVGSLAFGVIGIQRLESRVPVQNGRAHGALRKLGAVQEGVLRRSLKRGERHLDQALWSVLAEDWGSDWAPASPLVH
jgi:RimJ/RimL family protein N-acetyltransferase